MPAAQWVQAYALQIVISAPIQRVWNALTQETVAWWPYGFHTSPRTQRFVIEPVLGGRAYEDFGDGDGRQWYSVIGIETGLELTLAGHLLPPFGGPAVTALRLTLSAHQAGTLLEINDHRFGVLSGESPVDGWRFVFDAGLRKYVEGS